MAALPRSASRSSPAIARVPRLQILGYVLVVTALVFSAYCGFNAVRSSQAAALEAAAAGSRNPRALLVNRIKANEVRLGNSLRGSPTAFSCWAHNVSGPFTTSICTH
jgi:hypothetical protein